MDLSLKKYVLLDLDGTLTDTEEGVVNSFLYSLAKIGVTVDDRSSMRWIIGPPILDSYKRMLSCSDEEAKKLLAGYREYYNDRGIWENRLYDGVEEMLCRLFDGGKVLFTATSKPDVFAKRILDKHGVSKYFKYIYGSKLDGSISTKEEVLLNIINTEGIDISECVLVGDTKYDVLGAREVGMDVIGIRWGFGSDEEFVEYPPDMTFTTPDEVCKALLG
ncbi:MAG: HAD hydrolase-like protein [Clostridia bacterium]|nr:HAD hydrolase-like protein [Clostridia bacterium]